jgi:Spy/CpxP family protein refolding chaperone
MPYNMKKAPNASNYVGNPMGYYADKAAYGREMARRSMEHGGEHGGGYDSNIEALNVLEQEGDAMRARKQKRLDSKLKRKQTREKISSVNADIARNRSDKRAANQSNRRFGRR